MLLKYKIKLKRATLIISWIYGTHKWNYVLKTKFQLKFILTSTKILRTHKNS